MTCKGCIYDRVCPHLKDDDAIKCGAYADKSRFVELPCAVGDKVYWINRVAKEIETDIVVSIHLYEDGLSITTKTIGTKCTSTYCLDRFLEIMHFTKEAAEKALERSEGK